jgi:hypothetical protein
MPEKKEGWKEEKREKEKEKKRELSGFRVCFFSFLLKPWRSRTGPLPTLCRVTYKTSQNKGL